MCGLSAVCGMRLIVLPSAVSNLCKNMRWNTSLTDDVPTDLQRHVPECSGSRCMLMILAGRAAGYEENISRRLEEGSVAEEGVAPAVTGVDATVRRVILRVRRG